MMISTMRKGIQTKFFKALLWVVIAMFGLSYGIPELLSRWQRYSEWLININKTRITREEFDAKVREEQQSIEYMRRQFGQYAAMLGLPSNPYALALENLVRETLVDGVANQLDVIVDPSLVQQSIARMLPQDTTLEQLCSLLGKTPVQVEENIAQNLRRSTVLDIAQGALYIPRFVVDRQAASERAHKKFTVLHLPFAEFVKEQEQQPIAEHDLKTFFAKENAERKRYFIPEERSGIAWHFAVDTYGVPVSDDAVARVYEKNKRTTYVDRPAQVKVRTLTFASEQEARDARERLAKDTGLFAQEKGVKTLDFFARGTHDQALERASFSLEKDGDISPVTPVAGEYILAQRIEKRPATYKTLASVQADIKKQLTQDRFKQTFTAQAQRVLRTLDEQPGALEAFVKEHKGVKKETGAVSATNATPVAKRLFALKKGKYAVVVDGNSGVLVQLTDIKPGYLPKLEAVKARVEKDIRENRARDARDKELARITKQAHAGSLDKAKTALASTRSTTPFISKESAQEVDKLRKQGLPVDEMLALDAPNSVASTVEALTGDGYLFQLVERTLVAQEDAAAYETVKQSLYRTYKQRLEGGFVASLQRFATIDVSERLEQIYQKYSK